MTLKRYAALRKSVKEIPSLDVSVYAIAVSLGAIEPPDEGASSGSIDSNTGITTMNGGDFLSNFGAAGTLGPQGVISHG